MSIPPRLASSSDDIFAAADPLEDNDVKIQPSSSSSSSSSMQAPAPSSLPFEITASTEHVFDSYGDLLSFLEQHAAMRGFEIRWRPTGGENKHQHAGTARCWCANKPPSADAPAAIPSFPPARQRSMSSTAKASKQMKSSCPWSVSFFRRQAASSTSPQQYVITKRELTHNHPLLSTAEMSSIDSLRKVSHALENSVRIMVSNGMHGVESQRRYLEDVNGVRIDRDVFHNLVNRCKRQLGMVDNVDDFRHLLVWLQDEIRNKSAVARYHVDTEVGYEIDGVFYMSSDMAYHLDRNGVMLVMDTTFRTNRFHWPLLLVCGVNEHGQTIVFAVALLHHQTTAAFSWALEQMETAVSPEAWAAIAGIITDGDDAMAAAITAQLPNAAHLRCRFHLEQNLRHNLSGLLGDETEQFITTWKAVINKADVNEFSRAKETLHSDFAAAVPYLQRYHWINEQHFAECFIQTVTTLGIRSTQRVEGQNAALKRMFHVNSTTALAVLFQTMQYAAAEVDRQAAITQTRRTAERSMPKFTLI
jgi:SOS response regulatory protein OraA/RecX